MTLAIRPLLRAFFLWGLVCLVGTAGLSCSKPNRVDPADAAQVRSIDATVERLRQAYINKDAAAFQALLMPLDSLRRLELEIERDFAIYDRIQWTWDRPGSNRRHGRGGVISMAGAMAPEDRRPADPRARPCDSSPRGHQNLAVSGVDGDDPLE